MSSEFNNLLNEIQKAGNSFKQLDFRVNVLYDTQWAEKVSNGYELWRVNPDGGLKLIKEQLGKLAYKCPVCNELLSDTSATIDHLLPKSKYLGLAMDTNNMLVMCNSCNATKNNQEFKQWYSEMSLERQGRLCQAIQEIHGTNKLSELIQQ